MEMLEVIPHENGWRWRWICAAGRTLVETFETFPCDLSTWRAAKAYRVAFWAVADAIDHRMGACI